MRLNAGKTMNASTESRERKKTENARKFANEAIQTWLHKLHNINISNKHNLVEIGKYVSVRARAKPNRGRNAVRWCIVCNLNESETREKRPRNERNMYKQVNFVAANVNAENACSCCWHFFHGLFSMVRCSSSVYVLFFKFYSSHLAIHALLLSGEPNKNSFSDNRRTDQCVHACHKVCTSLC